MTIFSIPDVERFLDLVKKCQGDVALRLPDGNQVDLKNHTAQQLLQILRPGQSGLDISLSSAMDALSFIQYMMAANRSN